MAAAKPVRRLISHVILDLDGTLLNTGGILEEVMREFLVKYGKQWDHRSTQRIVGKTPLEAANGIVEDFRLPCSTEDFLSAVTPMFSEHCHNIKALPGANRLIRHLSGNQVPLALASNSPRSSIESKISCHHANLSAENFTHILAEQASGVYFGWAGLSTRGVCKMVTSIGWNPYFDNAEKIIEPWLLHEFDDDFYGEELRLAIVGYIRPEANFPSLESLIAKIHEDRRIAEKALELPLYAEYEDSSFLKIFADE